MNSRSALRQCMLMPPRHDPERRAFCAVGERLPDGAENSTRRFSPLLNDFGSVKRDLFDQGE